MSNNIQTNKRAYCNCTLCHGADVPATTASRHMMKKRFDESVPACTLERKDLQIILLK